jgi:hypothetical protein
MKIVIAYEEPKKCGKTGVFSRPEPDLNSGETAFHASGALVGILSYMGFD